MKTSRFLVLVLALWFAVGIRPSLAAPDAYDDSQSHPLRSLAYVVHPFAYLLEWTIFRPLHWFVSSTESLEAVYGHKPHPPLLSEPQPYSHYGVSKRVPLKEPQPPQKPVAKEPVPEKVRIVEVPVEKLVIKEVPQIVEVEKFVIPNVAFRFDSGDLTELGKGSVYVAAQKLKEKADLTIVIEGHTDYIGSDEYNQKLGLRRAQTVMKELADLGIDSARISAVSFGESKPLVDQSTDWARAVNRRVEFQVKSR